MTQSLPPKSIVLYADDDYEDVEMVKEAFSDYSQEIHLKTFETGSALLNYVYNKQEHHPLPCLIILDINMPGKSGKEVLKDLRQLNLYKEVPVVLFSTSTLPSEKAFAQSFNAGFVNKPLEIEHLNQLVDHITEHCADDVREIFKKSGRNKA